MDRLDKKTQRHAKVCRANMQRSLSWYHWQLSLRKELGDKYVGPSRSTMLKVISGLTWGLNHFDMILGTRSIINDDQRGNGFIATNPIETMDSYEFIGAKETL